ncbi:TonB-dependent receptor [Mucilaginibacter sp. UR6-1]|uniref:TonB-dependent receptor n=1 Tax=Mucilaginibacter sp. UR6-1 TaxID=1435643 RepID=UPI001E59C690|nr:TonB-dependent receptor [Mucilaginibacter sp. UR6-1]MCC8409282.1 TonB-dependent receptor [Mucilaginibacter sp. UR6-1]
MEFKKLLFLMLLVCGSSVAMAQRGIIKGKISGQANEPLAGATLLVNGTTSSAAADLNGEYQFYVNAGNLAVTVRYLGYKDTVVNVTVNAGQLKVLNIMMQSRQATLQDVVVTGYTEGQAKALNQQKNADNIKNIIAADQIGKFPDPNAAEALQRVPGVNIERDQGEGRYVSVRGLAPQFTNTSINGEQIPSPEADVRYVALDAIPSDQLASIEVTKALTPDMDGDAIGGSINLITRTAQTKTPAISGVIGGGYNNLMNKGNVQGQLQYGQRLGKNEKLGVLLNGNYYQNNLGSDGVERAINDNEVELRDYQLTRTRLGLSSSLDYRFNNHHEAYFRTIYSRFTDREWRRRYVFKPNDEEIEKLTKDRFEAQSVLSLNAGAKHTFKSFLLDYEAQYSYAEQNTPFDNEAAFVAGIPSTLNYTDTKYPSISTDEDYTNNSRYEFDELGMGNTLAKDKNLTAKFNVGIPYKINNSAGLIKFGAKVRSKDKSYSITQNTFENLGGVPNLNEFEGKPVKDEFMKGRYSMGNPLDVTSLIRYFNANPSQFELQIADKAADEALESYKASEDVFATYLMGRQQINKLMVLGGVRYERTKVGYNSKDVIIAANGDLEAIRPVTGSSVYDFVLPQLHLKYELDKFSNLRAAVTYSYARPNFSEIIPSQEINREDRLATIGNADLKPVKAINYDLMGEHYFGSVGIVSAGLFYKKLDNFIYRRTIFNSPYPTTGTPIIERIDITQSQNGNDADVLGAEIALQRRLSFIPFLRDFSVYLNYTYTHSKARIQSREANQDNANAQEEIRLPGQANHVGNASLAYEGKKFSARLSMNFNGSYLSELGGVSSEDIFINKRMQLDATAGYAITSKFRLFVEALNLTNQPLQAYQGTPNQYIQREFYSYWMRFGLKFNL